LPTVFNVVLSVDKALELHESEANKVFLPIKKFLEKNGVKYRCISLIGSIADKIVATAKDEHINLIVMGTHGRDFLGSTVMGSVAQKVLAQSTIPVMLVK
jgi:nucleotide-binding universal stress UspA family protein